MRVVALVSGGKDSCYNMMQCIAAGHEIVALANLKPLEKDELDSYMYQTVGHMGIPFLAEAMEIPLFRKETKGTSVSVGKHYEPTETDEVEDLFELLKMVKDSIHIDAVAVGAILSDYQRIRVENVCSRLSLVTLAYLWRRDQSELLQEMIDCKVKAIIIKVAALGLDPHKHLGRTLQQVQGHLLAMALQYGLNVCGEGGEYETFTLDCPLFKRKIELDISETIIDSNDPIAPVGYLNFTKLRLVDKLDKRSVIVKNSLDYVSDLNCSTYNDLSDPDLSESELEMIEKRQITMDKIRRSSTATVLVDKLSQMDLEKFKLESLSVSLNNLEKQNASCASNSEKNPNCDRTARPKLETQISNASFDCDVMLTPQVALFETIPMKVTPKIHRNRIGWAYIGGVQGYGETLEDGMKNAMTSLVELLQSIDYTTEHFCSITLGVRSMMQFTELNAIYIRYLPINNPPVRACVELALPENCYVIIDATCFKCPEKNGDVEVSEKRTMHVQGISHWAPANIGPYSQANRVGDIVHMAGQIGLIPGSMELIEGLKPQCKLALRHVSRIALAMGCTDQLRDVVQAICWVIHPALITECRRQWERCSNSALVQYVVCPKLPRGAAVEWSTWAHRHNKQFQYEETGCSVDDFTISIRSRWNYDNTVCAAICQLSTGSATSTTHLSDLSNENQRLKTKSLTTNMEQISKTLEYTVNKVLKNSQKNENSTLKLSIFYRVGYIDVISILEATNFVENLFEQNLVFTVVPVCNLQNYNTFLSICAVIYE